MPPSVSFGRRAAVESGVIAKARPQARVDTSVSLTPEIQSWLSSGPLARVPYFSVALLMVLTTLFVVELNAGPIGKDGAPTYGTLVAMGGVSRALVFKGEIWRAFTAP